MLIDTHCHIHESEFFVDSREEVYARAVQAGVAMLCVSTSERASGEALEFCQTHAGCYPVVGVHPHDAQNGWQQIRELVVNDLQQAICGIGEIGLDYYYMNSPRALQLEAFRAQLEVAIETNLPVSFHVRDYQAGAEGSVWDDFWSVMGDFPTIRGVLHSFADTQQQLDRALDKGLYIGINGISTFTKDPLQQQMYASIPIKKILLETDAPFLTPAPYRGTMNEPKYVRRVAEHVAAIHTVSVDDVIRQTTDNASQLFTRVGELRDYATTGTELSIPESSTRDS